MRDRPGRVQLSVSPLLACQPVVLYLFAKLLPGLDLSMRQLGLIGREVSGFCLTLLGSRQAEVRAVPSLWILLAPTLLPTALHGALGH